MTEALLSSDVLVAIIGALVTLLTATVGLVSRQLGNMKRENRAIREDTAATRYQVQNDHSTNLREDFDRMHTDLRSVLEGQTRQAETLRQHGASIGGLRDDLRLERVERLALAGRVDRIPQA